MYTILIIIGSLFIVYMLYNLINRKVQHKRMNKTLPNIVFKLMAYSYPEESREGLILNALNKVCKDNNKKLYKVDKYIMLSAKRRAEILDATNEIRHNGIGTEFILLKKKGADSSSEILGYAYRTVKSLIGHEEETRVKNGILIITREGTGWLGSISHRLAIINPDYDYVGIACILDEHSYWIDVVIFVNEKTVI